MHSHQLPSRRCGNLVFPTHSAFCHFWFVDAVSALTRAPAREVDAARLQDGVSFLLQGKSTPKEDAKQIVSGYRCGASWLGGCGAESQSRVTACSSDQEGYSSGSGCKLKSFSPAAFFSAYFFIQASQLLPAAVSRPENASAAISAYEIEIFSLEFFG